MQQSVKGWNITWTTASLHWACSITIFLSGVKRTISEVQLMHNVREHKQVGDRQDWLQEKLKDIIVASVKPQQGQSGNIKNVLPK
uniref:Parathyroid hormone n=1 Tax=Labrus bergylta TaxID=56723 RepID=A0A3Q3GR98_9LABR